MSLHASGTTYLIQPFRNTGSALHHREIWNNLLTGAKNPREGFNVLVFSISSPRVWIISDQSRVTLQMVPPAPHPARPLVLPRTVKPGPLVGDGEQRWPCSCHAHDTQRAVVRNILVFPSC